MYSNSHSKKNIKNKKMLKWSFIFIMLLTAVMYDCYFTKIIFSFRILCTFILICSTLFIFLYTEKGKKIVLFINESKNEVKKIIWPSKTETLYTAFIVSIVTMIMSLLIWGLDNILFHLVSFITNLRL